MQKSQLSEQTKGKIKVVLLVAIVTVAIGIFMYYFTFTSYGYNNWQFVIMNIVLFSVFFLPSVLPQETQPPTQQRLHSLHHRPIRRNVRYTFNHVLFYGNLRLQQNLQLRVPPYPSHGATALLHCLPLLGLPRIKDHNRRRYAACHLRMVPNLPGKRQARNHWTVQVHPQPPIHRVPLDNRRLKRPMANNYNNCDLASSAVIVLSAGKD